MTVMKYNVIIYTKIQIRILNNQIRHGETGG